MLNPAKSSLFQTVQLAMPLPLLLSHPADAYSLLVHGVQYIYMHSVITTQLFIMSVYVSICVCLLSDTCTMYIHTIFNVKLIHVKILWEQYIKHTKREISQQNNRQINIYLQSCVTHMHSTQYSSVILDSNFRPLIMMFKVVDH